MMDKLGPIIYVVAAPSLAGSGAIAALVTGSSTTIMVSAIAAGFILALPVSWLIAKNID